MIAQNNKLCIVSLVYIEMSIINYLISVNFIFTSVSQWRVVWKSTNKRTEIPLPLCLLCMHQIRHHPNVLWLETWLHHSSSLQGKWDGWMDGSTIIPPAEIFCKIAVKSWDCHFCILVLYSQSHLVNILEHRVCTPQPIAVASLRSRARLQRFPRMQEVFSICWSLLDIGEEGKVERKRKPKLNSFSTDISQVRKEKNRKCF